jgi:hypothetical protein
MNISTLIISNRFNWVWGRDERFCNTAACGKITTNISPQGLPGGMDKSSKRAQRRKIICNQGLDGDSPSSAVKHPSSGTSI